MQRSLLMRAASFDAAEAFADAKHQNSRVADARLRRKFGGVWVETLKNLPVRADTGLCADQIWLGGGRLIRHRLGNLPLRRRNLAHPVEREPAIKPQQEQADLHGEGIVEEQVEHRGQRIA